MSVYLPAAVQKDKVFSAVLDAAFTWKFKDSCPFRREHRRKLEKGDYRCSRDLVHITQWIIVRYAVRCFPRTKFVLLSPRRSISFM
jgi:hypothetical protein